MKDTETETRRAARTLLSDPHAVDTMAQTLMFHPEDGENDMWEFTDERVREHWRNTVRRMLHAAADHENQ